MKHRIGGTLFGLAVGLAAAFLAYDWISDPAPRAQRAAEESAVLAARDALGAIVEHDELEIVDPLAPNRRVGKVYVYAEPPGWAVSGYYRRGADDRWHPYLLTMDGAHDPKALKVEDPGLAGKAAELEFLEIVD